MERGLPGQEDLAADRAPAVARPDPRGRALRMIAGIGFAAVILAILIAKVDGAILAEMVERMPIGGLALALVIYTLLNVFRAVRYRALLQREHLPFTSLLAISLYHNFLARVLPFGTGEISYPLMVRGRLGIRTADSLGSLFAARASEMVMILGGGVAGVLTFGDENALLADFGAPVAALAFVLGVVGLYHAGAIGRLGLRGYLWVISLPGLSGRRLLARIGAKIEELSARLDEIRTPRLFATVLGISLLTYACNISFNITLLYSMGLDYDLGLMVVLCTLVMMISWLPIATASFGIPAAGWAFGLVAFAGMDVGSATSAGLLLNACQLGATTINGLAGYALLNVHRGRIPLEDARGGA
ncbi:MAG: flippase-like domain-containing protein [Myxococcales bacterium]|nr:flippase-like domain-containing protein [Myxococcales bacterium]